MKNKSTLYIDDDLLEEHLKALKQLPHRVALQLEADLLPLPENFQEYRDRLRVVGYELVRYTGFHALEAAARYRHQATDYEYAIHKIEFIDQKSGQIFINQNAFYSSERSVPSWTEHYTEKEKPEGFGVIKGWFSDPTKVLVTAISPPYGLAMFGLYAIGDHSQRQEQQERRQALNRFAEMPKFWPKNGA